MAATRRIFVRVTENQYQRVKNNAVSEGFLTVSSYIRDLALGKDQHFQKKFQSLYNKVMDNAESERSERPLTEFI